MRHLLLSLTVLLAAAAPLPPKRSLPAPIDAAIMTDAGRDPASPARMEVIHVPTGGVSINGVVYVAAGKGAHPTLVLLHGIPGNEKNLDLAQAVRRAGWSVVTFNYRGSWGSPGKYSFAGNLEDTKAVLAYVRDPANAARLGIDPKRIVLAGHSMGGWATAHVAAGDPGLSGAILISAGDIGKIGSMPHKMVVADMAENSETLTSTPEELAEEAIAHRADFDMTKAAPRLTKLPLLVLTSDDGIAPHSQALVAAIRHDGGTRVKTVHVATDHGWSDRRIRLESEVIAWLRKLP